MRKQLISSGYPFEAQYGYSRAVRAGNTVYVSGTTARDEYLDKDAYGQSKDILATISAALDEAGASLDNVVRTVVYVRSMDDVDLIVKIHGETFGAIRPASTIVEVSRLSPEQALVEIEVTAVLTDEPS